MKVRTRKILERFARRADEVLASRLARFSNETSSDSVRAPEPTTEQRISFLLDFRYFMDGREGIGIFGSGTEQSFLPVLKDSSLSERFRREVEQDIREIGQSLDTPSGMSFQIGRAVLPTKRDILYIVLYGTLSYISSDQEPAYRGWQALTIAKSEIDDNFHAILSEMMTTLELLRQRCREELSDG